LTDANGASTGGPQQNMILDAQGQAHFWVTGTGAGAATVRVDLPYQLGAGTVFSHLDSGAPTQRLVLAEGRMLTASATGELSLSAPAPPPSPTGPAQAPQPSLTAAAPPEQATPAATQEASAPTAMPPAPTRRPSHRTPTPASAEQPTETVIAETQATAVPTPPADTTAIPAAAPDIGGPLPPAGQAATAAPAGGAGRPRPSSLPNTGATETPVAWLLALSAGLLALGGWLVRRRIAR
jgi:LPXTG-motif cell wall-anchored protein